MKQKGREEDVKERSVFRKDDIDLLSNFQIPSTLDFRILSLKMNQQHIVNDIVEKGVTSVTASTFQGNFPD